MKTLKFFNAGLLILACCLLVTAVIAFVNNQIIYGICNILWMGCEIFFFLINKKSIEVKQRYLTALAILSNMNNIIEKYGSAIITENKNGEWETTAGGRNNPSCSAENNDNREIAHNAEGGKE